MTDSCCSTRRFSVMRPATPSSDRSGRNKTPARRASGTRSATGTPLHVVVVTSDRPALGVDNVGRWIMVEVEHPMSSGTSTAYVPMPAATTTMATATARRTLVRTETV